MRLLSPPICINTYVTLLLLHRILRTQLVVRKYGPNKRFRYLCVRLRATIKHLVSERPYACSEDYFILNRGGFSTTCPQRWVMDMQLTLLLPVTTRTFVGSIRTAFERTCHIFRVDTCSCSNIIGVRML